MKQLLPLPPQFVLFDTEFTAWEGSKERHWSGQNEHREIIQIGAIKVENAGLTETDAFSVFVKPILNPVLSAYIIRLTGITQEDVEHRGKDLAEAVTAFHQWVSGLPLYSFGLDGSVIAENCVLRNIPIPAIQCHNLHDFFQTHGIDTDQYFSSTLVQAFGVQPTRHGHDALNDVRTLLDALRLLRDLEMRHSQNR